MFEGFAERCGKCIGNEKFGNRDEVFDGFRTFAKSFLTFKKNLGKFRDSHFMFIEM